MSRGFFTIAQGDPYLRAAYGLALSLMASQNETTALTVGVTPGTTIPWKYTSVFDEVIEIPWKDHAANSSWKRENEWKSIYMTPYDDTIKLDADMIFTTDITHWWEIMSRSEGVFCTKPVTYRNEVITSDYYRKTFTDNNLPNIYTALFYFKKTDALFELFKLAEDIFKNWQQYYYEFLVPKSRPQFVSADVVFALAAKILNFAGVNQTPHIDVPTFVHMKTKIQGWETAVDEDWTKLIRTTFTPDCECKIGNYQLTRPLHYQQKHFLTDEMIGYLEKKVGV